MSIDGFGQCDCDVLICGLGPVGQLLALLLAQRGVSTIAVDEANRPYELPRAAVIDDEVLRIFQSIGLDRQILAAAQPQNAVSFITDDGRAIEVFRPGTGALGQPALVSIHQPSMERTMVAAFDSYDLIDARWGWRLEAFDRRADHVSVWLRPTSGGRSSELRARYLIGCDGSRSAVRSSLGIEFGGSTFSQRWLVVDVLVDKPLARVPHPHFVGSVERPIVCLPMSPGRHRWEWMLHPGEDGSPFLEPGRIEELIEPWLEDERATVERAVIYTFHSRTAERWRAGRVFLAGDAAHVTPPFVGQGFSSGARDAANLAWKLDAVLHGASERLLDTYETERRPHVTSMQTFAVRWGGVIQTSSKRIGGIRDRTIRFAERSGLLDWIQQRAKPLPTCRTGAFATRPHRMAFMRSTGALFPQPTVESADGVTAPLDELLGFGWAAIARDAGSAADLRELAVTVLELDVDFTDASGSATAWLQRHGVDWVVLRPDRFVFACGRRDQSADCGRTLRAVVGEGLRADLGADVGAFAEVAG